MSTTRTLVTGGAGFIGSHVCRALLDAGEEVVVLDDLSTGNMANLAGLDQLRLHFRRGTILDRRALEDAVRHCDYVIHLAAQVSVPASMEDPLDTHETNATGTLRVFEAARRAKVRRVVYAASCAIYGDDPALPKREDMPLDPLSPYAVSKYMGEVYAACYARTMGLEAVALRFFNVFGPRQDPSGGYAAVIPLFATRHLAGKPLQVHGDGEQTRDFVYVGNIASACLAARTAPDASGGVFNIGTGVETSLNELVALLGELTGRPPEVTHGPPRAGDVRRSVADISRAREALGWSPEVAFREGLERTLSWYREAERG